MKLIAWNSQGAKWGDAYTNFVAPALAADDVALCLVEAGFAPWVSNKVDITVNANYAMDWTKTWYDAVSVAADPFCIGVNKERTNTALWIPWMKKLDAAHIYLRCSVGGAWFKRSLSLHEITQYGIEGFLRPTLRMKIGGDKDVKLTLIFVHLISGYAKLASENILSTANMMSELITPGSPAIIVGDMNVDLLTVAPFNLPKGWGILRTGAATHQGGGELDYAIVYDPNNQFSKATAKCIEPWKTAKNGSDHGVIQYDLNLA